MMKIIKSLSWRDIDGSHRLMVALVTSAGILNFFVGELVPAGGGLGWDGVIYADMTRNLSSMISSGALSNYYAHKLLPSGIVGGMLLLFGSSFSDINIIRGFEIYNLVLLIGACWVWKILGDRFSISLGGRWLGFSGIFVNFNISKQIFYAPVITDVTALLVGLLLLLFYVKKQPIALFITTVMGAFAWPASGTYGAILLLFLGIQFPLDGVKIIESRFKIKSETASRLIKLLWTFLFAGAIIGYILLTQIETLSDASRVDAEWAMKLILWLVKKRPNLESYLTVAPSLAIEIIALSMLFGSWGYLTSVAKDLKNTKIYFIALSIASVLIPLGIVKAISNPLIPDANGLSWLYYYIIFNPDASGKILMPVITHTVFWGPMILLLLLHWRKFCIEARNLGFGVVSVVAISLPLGLVNEPRFVIGAWPFMVLGLVLALEKSQSQPSFKYAFSILTIIYAQFWITINYAPWTGGDYDGLLDFPKQLFFMHQGRWMSWMSYFIHIPIVTLSILWLRRSSLAAEAANG